MTCRTPRNRAGAAPVAAVLAVVSLAIAACGSGTSSAPPASSGSTSSTSGAATDYPTGPVTIISPVSAGSNGDLIARQLAKDVHLGATVSVVDRSGGAGIPGVAQVVQSAPDGATIGFAPNGVLMLQPQLKQLPYGKPSTYTPVAQVTEEFDALLVSASSRWKTLSQFLTYAKANPGKLRVEVAPTGSVPNVNVQLLEKDAGVSLTLVPGVGAASSVADLVGGHVDAVVGTINSAQSYIEAKKMRALAVMAPKRLSAYPSVPTLKESGYDVAESIRNFVIGPPHLPAAVVAKLVSALHAAVDTKSFQTFAKDTGVTVSFVSGSALTRQLDTEYASLGTYIKEFYSSSGS